MKDDSMERDLTFLFNVAQSKHMSSKRFTKAYVQGINITRGLASNTKIWQNETTYRQIIADLWLPYYKKD